MTEAVIAPATPAAPAVQSPAPPAPPAQPAPVASAPPAPSPSAAPGPAASPAPTSAPVASKWSETWREDMAGTLHEAATPEEKAEHEKTLTRLKRFNSPADAAKALREQDKLISSGALKKALPKNATEAQIAEWRKDNGIPADPKEYDLGLPKDTSLTERDQQMLSEFAASAHASNMTPDQVKVGVAAFMKTRAAIAEAFQTANVEAKRSTEDELRAEWGQEYRTNIDGLDSMLTHLGGDVSEALLNARTADGVQLLNNPAVVRALAAHARTLGFVGATVVPSGADVGASIDEEIKAIEASMFDANGNRSKEYQRDTKKQERYVKLLEARSRRG